MIYDISPPIGPSLAVWPGDPPPVREVLREIARGDHSTLSALHTTVHLGAHADAPSHISDGTPSIDERPLTHYLGQCQVISVDVPRGGLIALSDINVPIEAERVLFATGSYPDPSKFNEDYVALQPALIASLGKNGVKLIGVDTPSVDPCDADTMPAHKAAVAHDMAILEGLILQDVPDGMYELIALPLKLVGFDGSPVRAILRS